MRPAADSGNVVCRCRPRANQQGWRATLPCGFATTLGGAAKPRFRLRYQALSRPAVQKRLEAPPDERLQDLQRGNNQQRVPTTIGTSRKAPLRRRPPEREYLRDRRACHTAATITSRTTRQPGRSDQHRRGRMSVRGMNIRREPGPVSPDHYTVDQREWRGETCPASRRTRRWCRGSPKLSTLRQPRGLPIRGGQEGENPPL